MANPLAGMMTLRRVGTILEQPRTAVVDAHEYEDETFGLTVGEITADLRLALNLPTEVQGVIVGRVRPGSWAELAQLRAGVIIMTFGEQPVTNLEDFQAGVKRVVEDPRRECAVFGRARQVTGFFRLEPKWNGNDSDWLSILA